MRLESVSGALRPSARSAGRWADTALAVQARLCLLLATACWRLPPGRAGITGIRFADQLVALDAPHAAAAELP
jgi:hypothetical protein